MNIMYSNYKIKFGGTDKENEKMCEVLENYFESIKEKNLSLFSFAGSIDNKNINVEYDAINVYPEDIYERFTSLIVKENPNLNFTIEGESDTSEYGNGYNNFRIENKNRKVTLKSTGFWDTFDASSFADYEEFSEDFYKDDGVTPVFTEEEYNEYVAYEKLGNCLYFLVDDGLNDKDKIYKELPMILRKEETV